MLLSLLKQRQHLYHQLEVLARNHRQLDHTNSPELLIGIISKRRKLIEKIRQLEDKLRPIKTNWASLFAKIEPEQKLQAKQTVNQTQQIISQIRKFAPAGITDKLPSDTQWRFNELFAQSPT